jgi:hypothetical protein
MHISYVFCRNAHGVFLANQGSAGQIRGSQRSPKSQELVLEKEMGCYRRHGLLHFRVAPRLVHDRASPGSDQS